MKTKFEIFLIFFLFLKVRRPGRKTSGFRTVRILKILQTSRPDVMSGRALLNRHPYSLEAGAEKLIDIMIN